MGCPTKEEIREWFSLHETGKVPEFFETYVRDDVKWTVMVCGYGYMLANRAKGTNPLAGTYNSKQEFISGTVMILRKSLKPGMWDVEVTNVIAGGEQAAVELTVTSEVESLPIQWLIRSKRMANHS